MVAKRKSRLKRLLSLNQHRKRWGATKHAAESGFEGLRERIVDAGEVRQTHGSEKSIDLHLEDLRREFSGQSELLWHHAKLIVMIRREFRTSETFAQFCALWEAEQDFLCEKLNIRWLVSAADTFAEHHEDKLARAVAMMTPLLANTVKMQESERFVRNTGHAQPDETRIALLQTELVPLFEGMSVFTVGTDDTLRNMYWRLEPFFAVPPSGAILKTVWDRFQTEDTVFARMRALHRRDRTGWWN